MQIFTSDQVGLLGEILGIVGGTAEAKGVSVQQRLMLLDQVRDRRRACATEHRNLSLRERSIPGEIFLEISLAEEFFDGSSLTQGAVNVSRRKSDFAIRRQVYSRRGKEFPTLGGAEREIGGNRQDV